MQLSRRRSASDEDNTVSFPRLESWNPMTKVATIAAEVNKRRILCRISLDVLRKKFKASADEPMVAVAENRLLLQNAARKLIESKAFEEDGSIIIRQREL
ncbi:MAG: hypothetical protein ACI8W7_003213 [Gammaproteobacteria bacterium]|jgi:hypothetical protein